MARNMGNKTGDGYVAPEVEVICLSMEQGCLAKNSGGHENYEFDDTLLDLSDFGSMLI